MTTLIIPKDIDDRFKEGKSEETYRTYTAMLGKLFKEVFGTNKYDMSHLDKVKKVEAYLNSDTNPLSVTSKKLITIAAVMLLKASDAPKDLIDVYGKLARQYRIEDTQMRKHRPATEKERLASLHWDDIIQIREAYGACLNDPECTDEMTEKEYNRFFMKYVTLCLFTMIPPQRGQVFFKAYINRDLPDYNLIDLKKKQLIIRNEKTTKSYGTRIIDLPSDLVTVLTKWHKVVGDSLLLPNSLGEEMSTQSFTQFLKGIFNRDISTDMLRKIYVSDKIHSGVSREEREVMAAMMGHSLTQQAHSYDKQDWA